MKSGLMQVKVLSKVTTLQSLEWETESHRDVVEFRPLDEEGKKHSRPQKYWTEAKGYKTEPCLAAP